MKLFISFLILFFVISSLFANDFRSVRKVSLKKDEFVQIWIKYANKKKLFKLRWTLYVNKGLVIHKSYAKIVSQHILYLNHTNQSIREELKPRGADFYNVPYLLLKFKEFNLEKNEADFEIYLSDERMQINMKYMKK